MPQDNCKLAFLLQLYQVLFNEGKLIVSVIELSPDVHVMEIAALSIQRKYSCIQRFDISAVVAMLCVRVLLGFWYPELEQVSYLLCWLDLIKVPLTIWE